MNTHYDELMPYITKDGSIIREMMHPKVHGNQGASIAEARVPVGASTIMHRHLVSEEIYVVIQGCGTMRLGETQIGISTGDTITIPPQALHNVTNTGSTELVLLCVCVPPYTHKDTVLVE